MARCGDAGLKHELHCQCRRAQWHATRTENNEGARFAKARHAAALKERLERNSASNLWEGKIFRSKNTLRGRPSGRRPPARQKAAHIWRDRDRLHTCRGNRARAPGRKPPQPSRVEARTQIRHAASPGEGARGWGSERASHHMGLGAAASASGAVEPKGGLVSCWGAHRGSCQPWGPALAEHRARAQHAGRSAAAVGPGQPAGAVPGL